MAKQHLKKLRNRKTNSRQKAHLVVVSKWDSNQQCNKKDPKLHLNKNPHLVQVFPCLKNNQLLAQLKHLYHQQPKMQVEHSAASPCNNPKSNREYNHQCKNPLLETSSWALLKRRKMQQGRCQSDHLMVAQVINFYSRRVLKM